MAKKPSAPPDLSPLYYDPIADAKYQMHLTGTQAVTIVNALELLARVGMGQLGEVAMWAENEGMSGEDQAKLREGLVALQAIVSPNGHPHAHYGISSPSIHERNRVAWDVMRVIRHRLAWDRYRAELQPGDDALARPFGVCFDTPIRFSIEPLPTIAKVINEPASNTEEQPNR